MPSFKPWILLALALFAIVFPRSTIVAEDVPSDKEIVGSWKVTLVFDPKKWKAASAEHKEYWEVFKQSFFDSMSVEIRADGTMVEQFFIDGEKQEHKRTWKLVDKRGKKLVTNDTDNWRTKSTDDFAWISKDEFTTSITIDKTPEEIFGLVTGLHYHRIKDAPKP